MDVKKLWGVILIVLSVSLILGGASHYYELATLDTLVQASMADYGKVAKTWFGASSIGKTYAVAVRNEKVLSVVGVILGICLAVIGTQLVREAAPTRYRVRVDFDDTEDDDLEELSGTQKFKL